MYSEEIIHSEEFSVTIEKEEGVSFGFEIKGRTKECPQLTIGDIVPEGPADKAGVQKGDEIITVENKDVKQATRAEVNRLRCIAGNNDGMVTLGLRRHVQKGSDIDTGKTVHLEFKEPVKQNFEHSKEIVSNECVKDSTHRHEHVPSLRSKAAVEIISSDNEKSDKVSHDHNEKASDLYDHVTLRKRFDKHSKAKVAIETSSSKQEKSKLLPSDEDERASDFYGAKVTLEASSSKQEKSKSYLSNEDKSASDFYGTTVVLEISSSNQKKSNSSLSDEDKRASDFYGFISNITQVVEESVSSEYESPKTLKLDNTSSLEVTKRSDINVTIPGDKEKVVVMGALSVLDTLVIVDNSNSVLKMFDISGRYLSSTKLRDDADTRGITCVPVNRLATCDLHSLKVSLLTIKDQEVTLDKSSYGVGHRADGISYNGTYYCVLHRDINAITVLNKRGSKIGTYAMKEDEDEMKLKFGCDILIESETNNIFVPCWETNGLLCMTEKGEALWFKPFDFRFEGITEMKGTLCLADSVNCCLHLINKNGDYEGKLLDKEDLTGTPRLVSYDGHSGRLYVTYDSWRDYGTISVYNVNEVK